MARSAQEELLVAAQCAANILALLKPELTAMGCRADRVPEKLRAAINAVRAERAANDAEVR